MYKREKKEAILYSFIILAFIVYALTSCVASSKYGCPSTHVIGYGANGHGAKSIH